MMDELKRVAPAVAGFLTANLDWPVRDGQEPKDYCFAAVAADVALLISPGFLLRRANVLLLNGLG
jgi:hypothetical protein